MGRLEKVVRTAGANLLADKVRKSSQDGLVIQRQEARTFNPENVGSNPARPTTNILVAKKCDHCNQPMHIHRQDDQVIFSGCEPCIIDIRLERVGNDQALIKGRQSSKAVRCGNCHRKHLLRTFEEVKDGSEQEQASGVSR